MKKIILISCIIIVLIFAMMIIAWDLFVEIERSYRGLEFVIPIICRREVTTLQHGNFFDEERLEKMYLSKFQAKRVLKEIENNSNWIKGELNEKVEERLNFYTREEIYNQIPYVENKYWIFTNKSSAAKDKHSIDEVKKQCIILSHLECLMWTITFCIIMNMQDKKGGLNEKESFVYYNGYNLLFYYLWYYFSYSKKNRL